MKEDDVRQEVANAIAVTVQEWLDLNKGSLGLRRGQKIKVSTDPCCPLGTIQVTFVGKFGQGSWKKITDHLRNGGMESLLPHLNRLNWNNPRSVTTARQRSLTERRLRIREHKG